ncbi:hypothetical protein E2C01_047001 [Portunus trituberculatus]|uniref:Uncharacterized protein n=1 Tax=Portunus trituberculatus TaxID=210409 RepID=A0A5B7G6J9_PORTR|nr:hypothetical protein [Portunus trituberculatus]
MTVRSWERKTRPPANEGAVVAVVVLVVWAAVWHSARPSHAHSRLLAPLRRHQSTNARKAQHSIQAPLECEVL